MDKLEKDMILQILANQAHIMRFCQAALQGNSIVSSMSPSEFDIYINNTEALMNDLMNETE
jgi:hypothetical protein